MNRIVGYFFAITLAFSAGLVSAAALSKLGAEKQVIGAIWSAVDAMGNVQASQD
jgi:hypothetical protein